VAAGQTSARAPCPPQARSGSPLSSEGTHRFHRFRTQEPDAVHVAERGRVHPRQRSGVRDHVRSGQLCCANVPRVEPAVLGHEPIRERAAQVGRAGGNRVRVFEDRLERRGRLADRDDTQAEPLEEQAVIASMFFGGGCAPPSDNRPPLEIHRACRSELEIRLEVQAEGIDDLAPPWRRLAADASHHSVLSTAPVSPARASRTSAPCRSQSSGTRRRSAHGGGS
jgi:hypothetical protein